MMYSGYLSDFLTLCDFHAISEKYLTRPETLSLGTAKNVWNIENMMIFPLIDDFSIDTGGGMAYTDEKHRQVSASEKFARVACVAHSLQEVRHISSSLRNGHPAFQRHGGIDAVASAVRHTV
jgi:hypothetical protein